MEDDDWLDTSTIGSKYEEQTHLRTGKRRHRRRIYKKGHKEGSLEAWEDGPSPDNPHLPNWMYGSR